MADLFENPDDVIEVEPAELRPAFSEVMSSVLAKDLAGNYKTHWSDQQEAELQEHVSRLVAAAKGLGRKSILVIVTRPDGQKVARELDVERINQTRSLH